MADFKDNKAVQAELKKLEDYIQTKIQTDFPTIRVQAIGEYDQDAEGDLVGVFQDDGSRQYSFLIQKGGGNPILQRVA